jgi:casein kinase II subunit alpha
MHELLKGLKYAHDNGVMHRDIRPHNVVIDHEQRRLRIVGWGSAAFYHPGEEYTYRVGTFKPPELLLINLFYDCKIDIWGFGSMLISMVFREEPFFHGSCIQDQIVKIANVIGSEELYQYVSDDGLDLDRETVDMLGDLPAKDLWTYVNESNQHLVDEQVLDLLRGLLRWDPKVSASSFDATLRSMISRLLSVS